MRPLRKLFRSFIQKIKPGIPGRIPPFVRFTYLNKNWNHKTRSATTERITLSREKIQFESLVEDGSGTEPVRQDMTFNLTDSELKLFYNQLRKHRFDLIPAPYTHFSNHDYSRGFSETMELEVGETEEAVKDFVTGTGSDLGLEGDDLQKFRRITDAISQLLRNKSSL